MLRILITLLLIVGIIVTQAYVIGFEYHRFFTPSWFFLVVAGLIIFAKPPVIARGNAFVYGSLGLLTLYLGLRGLLADLPFLAGKDFPVLYYGLITFAAMGVIARSKKLFFFLIAVAAGVHCYQIIVSLLPDEVAGNLPRAWGELPRQKGIPGFFRHYNPFASYCGLNTAALVGLMFLKLRNQPLEVGIKLASIFVAIITVIAAFYSGSRLGTAVTVLSFIMSLLLGFGLRLTFAHGRLQSKNRLVSMLLLIILGICGSVPIFYQAFNKVSEQEWRVGSGDIEEDIVHGIRLSTIGMGFSLWQEQPLVGSGPRSYWVHAPRLREEGIGGFSDPEMVHNDYVQTLAEYGIIGLLFVLGSIGIMIYMIWSTAYRQRFINENWIVPPIIASSATIGIMIHALADFTMHNTAVFVQLSLILGASYGYVAATDPGLGTRSHKSSWLPYMLKTITVIMASALIFLIGKNQIIHNIELVKYDYAKWNSAENTYLEKAYRAGQLAPEPILLEEVGLALFHQMRVTSNPNNKALLLKEAENNFARGHAIHPNRIPLVTNLALTKINQGQLNDAEDLIVKAFKLSNHRWRSYHIDRLVVELLRRKGERLWLQERNSSDAMAYFQEAEKYLTEGRLNRYRSQRKFKKHHMEKVKEYLSTLEGGKITPNESINFFEGRGL